MWVQRSSLCCSLDSACFLSPPVRQHLSRLPTIDPNTRTLLLCGYPNVGKSSFINKVLFVVLQSSEYTSSGISWTQMDQRFPSVLIFLRQKLNRRNRACVFLPQVTRADVDVQPYAFTTKSLFVGHMDYRYLRWQVRVRAQNFYISSSQPVTC